MIPQDFSKRSRDDRKEFESIREKCFEQTEEERLQVEIENERRRKEIILQRITAKWITMPSNITKERMLTVMKWLNANQFLWEDLSWYIDKQLELFWSLEKVMDNLVLTYL